jgi:hypothetical protein
MALAGYELPVKKENLLGVTYERLIATSVQ